MFKNLVATILSIAIIGVSGCARVLTAEETAPNIINVPKEPINIAVQDARPYVVDGDKDPNFEGLIRSALGIPYSQSTVTKEPLADYIVKRLDAGFKQKGVEVNVLPTTHDVDKMTLVKKIAETGNKGVIITLNEWKYDHHSFSDNSWYDIDVAIYDGFGVEKVVKQFKGENDIPDFDDAIVNELQLIYKARFEEVFRDPTVQKALLN